MATTGFLDVPGARLHYEVRGAGPPLVLLHGNPGAGAIFQFIAEPLAEHYTVITYDARGNSRSTLTTDAPGPQPVPERADDALAVIDALTGEPPFVFGTSGGAVTSLDLLTRYPDRVRLVIAHEPSTFSVLPDAPVHAAFFAGVHAAFLVKGVDAAFAEFSRGIGGPPRTEPIDLPPEAGELFEHLHANLAFMMGKEMLDVVGYPPDLIALAKSAEKLIFAVGAESREYRPALPALWLAPETGAELLEFPGDHSGYLHTAGSFAATLRDVLAAHAN